MNKMSKTKLLTFYVEGPDWENEVQLDPELFDDERSQLLEAGTLAMEKQMKFCTTTINFGAVLLIKKSKTSKKVAMVNTYLCLINMAQYSMAEELRRGFKKESGQDLATDTNGYSY